MDTQKTGKLIAALRRQNGLTQGVLGEKLGVTNKTVSRWENGNYLPDIEMLNLLAKEFGVSMDELLEGELSPDENRGENAAKNIAGTKKSGSFTIEEQKAYYKKKWRKEHIGLFVLLGSLLAVVVVLPLVFCIPSLLGLALLVAMIEYGYQNNKMMAYVEEHIWG